MLPFFMLQFALAFSGFMFGFCAQFLPFLNPGLPLKVKLRSDEFHFNRQISNCSTAYTSSSGKSQFIENLKINFTYLKTLVWAWTLSSDDLTWRHVRSRWTLRIGLSNRRPHDIWSVGIPCASCLFFQHDHWGKIFFKQIIFSFARSLPPQ